MSNSVSRESDFDPLTGHEYPSSAAEPEGEPVPTAEPLGLAVDVPTPSEPGAHSNGSTADQDRDDTNPIGADELLDALLGEEAIDPYAVQDGAPPLPPSAFEIENENEQEPTPEPASVLDTGPILEGESTPETGPVPVIHPAPETHPAPESHPAPEVKPDRLATRATTPALGALELRQIAGLTAGTTMPLEPELYDFAQDGGDVGFQIDVDLEDRAVVIPKTIVTKVDGVEIDGPTSIGFGVLDAGSARFVVRHRLERHRPTDWLDVHDAADDAEPLIEVPAGLGQHSAFESAGKGKKRRRKLRRRRKDRTAGSDRELSRLDPAAAELVERVRSARIEVTDRERAVHPDPAELAERARRRAPILGVRPPGHPLFGKVSVLAADIPWLPRLDDINAIPDEVGAHLTPLMTLPSQPIVADLMVGPLGIVGHPNATMACARHIATSLYGLSTAELRLHIATVDERADRWNWSRDLAPPAPVDTGYAFPVVIVDGMESFASSGLAHADAIEHRAGAVFLADNVEDLPSYCGTVLQVDEAGSGLLTNHLGHIISGTPIGITTAFASELADDLVAVMERRHR